MKYGGTSPKKISIGLEMTECIQGSFFFSRNFEKFVKNEIGRARTIWEG